MSIRTNMNVKIVGGFHDGKTGKVVTIYPTIDIAIVSLDDTGDVAKIPFSELIEILPQEKETRPEIPEGAKKISRDDYTHALLDATSPRNVNIDSIGDLLAATSTLIIGNRISDEIFKDRDAVVMTEAEFISTLWDACRPAKVAEYGNYNEVDRGVTHVSITAIVGLEEIVGILFDADNA